MFRKYRDSALSKFGYDQLVAEVLLQLNSPTPLSECSNSVAASLATKIVHASGLYHDPAKIGTVGNTADRIRQNQKLDQLEAQLNDASGAIDQVIETVERILSQLPHLRNSSPDPKPDSIKFSVSNADLITDPAALALRIVDTLLADAAKSEARGYVLFAPLTAAIEGNVKHASGLPRDQQWPKGKSFRSEAEKHLSKMTGTTNLFATVFAGTPLADLFTGHTQLEIGQDERVEHMHLLAPSGAGKTRTLEYLITQDLKSVSTGAASILVMESEGGLVNRLARHAYRDPNRQNSISDRVTLIDPGRPGAMPTFSLFGIVGSNLRGASAIERETITNSVTDLYRYVFRALRGGELTERQGYIFNKLIQMLIWVEGASFGTLLTCLKDADEAARLSSAAPAPLAAFFVEEYALRTYQTTRTELFQRLDTFKSSAETLNRMLSGVVTTFDLMADLDEGRLILINTNKEILGEEGSQIFGRFIIALLRLLSFKRGEHSKPLFLYLDEAYEYIDEKVTALFRQGRKRKIGIIVAHQELAQLDKISSDTRHAIQTNTQIKLSGNGDHRDRLEMARNMGGTSPEFFTTLVKQQRVYTEFGLFIRNQTPGGAVRVRIPLGTMEKLGFVEAFPAPRWPDTSGAEEPKDVVTSSDDAQHRQAGKWIDPWED